MFIEKLRKSEALKEFLEFNGNILEKESDIVKEKLFEKMFNKLEEELQYIQNCESPVEKIFLMSLEPLIGYNALYGITSAIIE